MEKMNIEKLEKINGGQAAGKSSRKVSCPNCGKPISIPSPAPAFVKCSCGTKVTIVKKPF